MCNFDKNKPAHGFLFDGQFEKAKELYLEIIKSVDQIDSKTVKDQILSYFKYLRNKGFIHKNMVAIEQVLR